MARKKKEQPKIPSAPPSAPPRRKKGTKKPIPTDPLGIFYHTLEETPGDKVTMLALADWYEENGHEPDAACIRWAAERQAIPYKYKHNTLKVSFEEWGNGWFWWAVDDPGYGSDWGHSTNCRLPRDIWSKLRHTFSYSPAVFKEYETQREAYEVLIELWRKAPPRKTTRKRNAKKSS